MAKVDVLLTFWGDVELLKKAVDSVIAQTETDWRLVIIDDHYPSKEPATLYKNHKDPRIVYRRNKENLGITKNFNLALELAEADFCVHLGCDDVLLPDYLERALSTIGDADIYQPGVKVIDKDGLEHVPNVDKIKRVLRPKKPGIYKEEQLAASLCRGNWLYFPSLLWRTSTVKKYRFDESYKIVEDVDLQLRMIIDGASLRVDNQVTFCYRRFAQSLSSKEKRKGGVRFNEEDAVYDHFSTVFRKMGWRRASRAAKTRVISRLHRLMT